MIGQDVSLGIPLHPIKCAESAELLTDIRVVYVPVDNVADDIVGVTPNTNLIRGLRKVQEVGLFKQEDRLIRSYASPLTGGLQNSLSVCHKNSSDLADLIAPTRL